MSKTATKLPANLSVFSSLLRPQVLRAVCLCVPLAICCQTACGQWEGRERQLEKVEKTFGDPPGMVRLDPQSRIWVDKKNKRIVVDGYIALKAGQLEMLACIVGTKEHESVVAVFSQAQLIHAGLLAVGAQQGEPVKWEPKYTPPTGSEVQVIALWKDKDGKKQKIDTRKWVRQVGTDDKILDTNFVFAGSIMWKDPDTGEERYMAEGGDLICVSNFSTATLDVPMKSSQVNSGLLFAAFTDRIPERETPIRLVLQVVEPKKSADARPLPAGGSDESPEQPGDLDAVPSLEGLTEGPS